ncbi:MAG: hypothetical protein ACFCVE_04500 [Phycisphaerae bacterium]
MFLFADLARRKFGLRVESIQGGFPDCTARGPDGKRVRIEFEYRSSGFKAHKHDARGCDWIVCWIHDWPDAPKHLRVVELRHEYGLGFNVWVQPVKDTYATRIAVIDTSPQWSVASRAAQGDLVLFYRTRSEALIADVFEITTPVGRPIAGWKPGRDYMAGIRRVATLKSPLHLEQLKEHRVLRTCSAVRGGFQTRFCISSHWPDFLRLILAHNRNLKRSFDRFGPERLAV